MTPGALDGNPPVIVEENVAVPMRDGTVLRADVFRLGDSTGPAPVALSRTPYDKTRADDRRVATALARAGYIAVVQDIRGRNASDGEWVWHLSHEGSVVERSDGYDTVMWTTSLPGSDGTAGVWGHSYPGWLAWLAAASQPDPLRAILTAGFAPSTTDCTYGVFETGIRLRWQHRMAVSSRRRVGDVAFPSTVEEAAHHWDDLLRGKWIWSLPLDAVPDELFGPDAGMQRQYWKQIATDFWRLDEVHPEVLVPTCTITGWWDRLNGAADHFSGMVRNGPRATRNHHRLLIGPWLHDMVAFGDTVGPGNDESATIRFEDEVIAWFDRHVRGLPAPAEDPPVRLMLVNEQEWRDVSTWPPPGTTVFTLHLHSGGSANTPGGDGRLSTAEAVSEPPDVYRYDPADPVLSLQQPSRQMSAADLRPHDVRTDILVYQTPPLEEDIVVVGRPEVRLWAASDRVDTDFIARLVQVDEGGRAFNLAQGMVRARYRAGFDRELPLAPGSVEEFVIPLANTGIRFSAGSRIRLDITSSDFPNFDRNHNTGLPFESDPDLLVANQTVWHDAAHPSRLILTTLPDHNDEERPA